MFTKTERTVAIIFALIVLLITMLAPWISVVISVVALAAFGVYRLIKKIKQQT